MQRADGAQTLTTNILNSNSLEEPEHFIRRIARETSPPCSVLGTLRPKRPSRSITPILGPNLAQKAVFREAPFVFGAHGIEMGSDKEAFLQSESKPSFEQAEGRQPHCSGCRCRLPESRSACRKKCPRVQSSYAAKLTWRAAQTKPSDSRKPCALQNPEVLMLTLDLNPPPPPRKVGRLVA